MRSMPGGFIPSEPTYSAMHHFWDLTRFRMRSNLTVSWFCFLFKDTCRTMLKGLRTNLLVASFLPESGVCVLFHCFGFKAQSRHCQMLWSGPLQVKKAFWKTLHKCLVAHYRRTQAGRFLNDAGMGLISERMVGSFFWAFSRIVDSASLSKGNSCAKSCVKRP